MRKGSGDIRKIGDLFEKYRKTLVAPQKTVVAAFCEVVEDVIDINVDESSVRYSPANKTLSFTRQGPLKTEILLHKEEILLHLKGRLGEKSAPKDIL